jgi:putative hydrolase of the HAD superfamily
VVRAIAFDLFHTLVDPDDFRPPEFRRAREVARLLGVPVDPFVERWAAGFPERLVTAAPSVAERAMALAKELGASPDPAGAPAVAALLGRFTDLALLSPRRSVLATIERLRTDGWVLGLLSNCDELERRRWPDSPLSRLLPAALFSCDLGLAKPDPAAFRSLVPRWGGVPLEEAIFVGDGGHDELEGARRAGFAKVIFQHQFVSVNGLRPAEANRVLRSQADATLEDLAELPALVGAPTRAP